MTTSWIKTSERRPSPGALIVKRWLPSKAVWAGVYSGSDKDSSFDEWVELPAPGTSPFSAPVACPYPSSMGKHACADKSQCWEPCSDLGHSMEHVRASPAPVADLVVTDAPSLGDRVRWALAAWRKARNEQHADEYEAMVRAILAAQSGAGTRGEQT